MAAEGRRRNTRVPFQATVNLRFAGGEYLQCETRDLGVRGVFVVGVQGPAAGEACETELCLSGTSSRICLAMEGLVARTDGEGLALHFTGMDFDSFFHLRNIIYYNSGDPDALGEWLLPETAAD